MPRPDDSTGASRLPSLTGARFVAAALVFSFHFAYQFPFASPSVGAAYSHAVSMAGSLGVAFFFVLSGFVLTWTAKPGEPARLFWRRRVVKIYPNHLVTLVLTVGLMFWAGTAPTFAEAIPNALLVHAWIPHADIFLGMNDVTWTLSCEMLFYLSFPLLHRLVSRVSPRRLWALAAGVVAGMFAVSLISYLLPAQPQSFGVPTWRVWFVYILPATRLLDFVLGIVVARIVLSGRWIRLGMLPAALLVAVGYWVTLRIPQNFGWVAVCAAPLALFIAAAASADIEGRRSILRGRVMVWLGEVSFAFYLVHNLVLTYGHRALGATRVWSTPEAAALGLLAFGVSILAAWLLYRFVEVPMMRRFARPRNGRTAGRQAAEPGLAKASA